MTNRRVRIPILILAGLFAAYALAVYLIDPYLHYHAPWFGLTPQRTGDSRFESYGLARFTDYDSIMLGTSVTQDAKASEYEALYGGKALRVKFAGAYFQELGNFLRYALDNHEGVERVFWVLDLTHLLTYADTVGHTDNPEYLYDDLFRNDAAYLLNKDVFPDLLRALFNISPVDYDWQVWNDPTGLDALLPVYAPNRPEPQAEIAFTEDIAERVRANFESNIVSIARAYLETEFTFVFPCGNAFFWDYSIRNGEFDCMLAALELAAGDLLALPNARVFCYADDPDKTLDFERYKDRVHFDPGIMSDIIADTAAGRGQLTQDTLAARVDGLRAFWLSYDYDALYEGAIDGEEQ